MTQLIFPVNNVGQYGLIKDLPPQELPPNAWSDGKNFRFRNGYAERISGHLQTYDPPTVAPYYLAPIQTPVSYFWVYLSLLKAYVFDGAVHTDLTRTVGGDYAANANDNWTHCILGGVPVFNNSGDTPQMWLPVSTAQRLQALTNWPAATTCQAMRAFKQFLVALDVTKSGTRYPQMIKWSHPADPGTVPTSWNEADATKDAGEYSLSETGDRVLDSAPLRDINIVYKENTTWGMQFIGGVDIFRFFSIFNAAGLLSRRCAQEFFSGIHAVFGDDDIYQHNGQNATSLLTRKLKRSIFSRIDTSNYVRSFTAVNFATHEVWFCFPEIGSSFSNMAVVWNWDENTVSLRELPLAAHIAPGVSNAGATSDAWSADAASWDSDVTTWDERIYSPATRGLFMAVPGAIKIHQAEQTLQFNGTNYTSFIERMGLGIPLRAGQPPDMSKEKYLTAIYPRAEGTQGGVVKVYVAGVQSVTDTPAYGAARLFTLGTSKRIDCRIPGKLFAIKFEIDTPIDFKLAGYELEVRAMGR